MESVGTIEVEGFMVHAAAKLVLRGKLVLEVARHPNGGVVVQATFPETDESGVKLALAKLTKYLTSADDACIARDANLIRAAEEMDQVKEEAVTLTPGGINASEHQERSNA